MNSRSRELSKTGSKRVRERERETLTLGCKIKLGVNSFIQVSQNFHSFICASSRDGNGPEEANLTEPLVTFPDPDTPPPVSDAVTLAGSPSQLSSLNSLNNLHHGMNPPMNIPNMPNLPAGQETMKFEQKKMTSASKTKVRRVSSALSDHCFSLFLLFLILHSSSTC